jgi:hypothetical protein
MTLPETYHFSRDGRHKMRFYLRKAYKKARHKRAARRFPYECWM